MEEDFVCTIKSAKWLQDDAMHALLIPTEATAIGSIRFWCCDCESDIFLGIERFSKRCDERIAVFTIESTL